VNLTGFRTSVFQLSSDHTRVINYAQWASKEIYERSMADLEPKDNPVIPVITRHGARDVLDECSPVPDMQRYAAHRCTNAEQTGLWRL